MTEHRRSKQDLKALYICLEESSKNVFFASMENIDGLVATLRSSTAVERGAMVYLTPVPKDWDGERPTPDRLMNSPNLKCGLVSRVVRGTFFLRLLSDEAQHVRKQIRDGTVGLDDLTVDVSDIGAITTLRVKGGLGLSSVTRLQAALANLKPAQLLVLLDLTDMTVTADTAVGRLFQFIQDSEKDERTICVLSRPNSRFIEILAKRDSEEMISIHTKRDMAVASLLKSTLE